MIWDSQSEQLPASGPAAPPEQSVLQERSLHLNSFRWETERQGTYCSRAPFSCATSLVSLHQVLLCTQDLGRVHTCLPCRAVRCLGLIHWSNERSSPEKWHTFCPSDSACRDKSFLSIQQGLFGFGGTVGSPPPAPAPTRIACLALKYKKCKLLYLLPALPGPCRSLSAGPLRGHG